MRVRFSLSDLGRLAALAPIAVLIGCAHPADEIAAKPVPASAFSTYECAQIAADSQQISARLDELKGQVDETAASDERRTAWGILVFPPLLFFLNGDGADAEEYSRLKGEYAALHAASTEKKCGSSNPT